MKHTARALNPGERSQMRVNIEQEKLCDFCKDYHDNPSMENTCEGSFCKKMEEAYLENYGIISEKALFKQLEPSDYIYVISWDKLLKREVKSVHNKGNEIVLHLYDSAYQVSPNKSESIDTEKHIKIFMSKGEAIQNYEALITKRLREMTHNLLEIQKG